MESSEEKARLNQKKTAAFSHKAAATLQSKDLCGGSCLPTSRLASHSLKETGAFARRFFRKKITPEQQSLLDGTNPRQYPANGR